MDNDVTQEMIDQVFKDLMADELAETQALEEAYKLFQELEAA